jgi:hypothetical protein
VSGRPTTNFRKNFSRIKPSLRSPLKIKVAMSFKMSSTDILQIYTRSISNFFNPISG